ncbi:ABC transporter ATP-binding protein [Eoetvoesiella caeni]
MLQLENISAFYGKSQALHGVSLSVGQGEVVGLLGRNGMGKTTTVRCIFGLMTPREGQVSYKGIATQNLPPHIIARQGLGLVPEGRQIFPLLTVEENLKATARARPDGTSAWSLEKIYKLFRPLVARRHNLGSHLSGGEQQMLAIGRALMTNPDLLVLDEATEGLAPLVREEIWRCIADLKDKGHAILIIDKHLERLGAVADRYFILEKGRTVWEGNPRALREDKQLQKRYLEV